MVEEKKQWYLDILRLMEYSEFPKNASKKDNVVEISCEKIFYFQWGFVQEGQSYTS